MLVLLVNYLITGLRSSVERATLIKDNNLLSSTSYKSLKMVHKHITQLLDMG